MFILSKEYSFEASHRLAKGFVGRCNNIHGHSWHGEVQFAVNDIMDYDMGVDYAKLKLIINSAIDKYDHALILCKEDLDIADFMLKRGNDRVIVMDENPTSEVLARLISKDVSLELIKAGYFESNVRVFKVVLKETATSKCEY